jgi:NAD(P)-dependent dehydrogenase (short-subunit alcohol dehydrogenase family)
LACGHLIERGRAPSDHSRLGTEADFFHRHGASDFLVHVIPLALVNSMTDLNLKSKNAVVYGAAGAIGTAVSQAFARAGARVFLCGRTSQPLEALAKQIASAGGSVEVTPLDALNASAVERHAEAVASKGGSLDISFNLITVPHIQGRTLVDLTEEDFAKPIRDTAATHFITATAAARRMVAQRRGVILMMTTQPGRLAMPLSGPFGAACALVEAFARNLAGEVGPSGVRVNSLLSTGSPEAPGVTAAMALHAKGHGKSLEEMKASFTSQTPLRRFTTLEDVARTATFLASDHASAITASAVNISCGLMPT